MTKAFDTKAEQEAYQAGIQEGQLEALKRRLDVHDRRFDDHENKFKAHDVRFRDIEKIIWMMIGIIAFMNFFPTIKSFLSIP